jgi:predicted membrane-bound spermidine synthase
VLGQIKVVEFKVNNHHMATHCLLVNHNWQTWIDKDHPSFSFLYYTHFTDAIIAHLPPGSKALLIGLGGGTVAKQFEAHNVAYDVVEIDGRLPALAKEYFGLKGTGNVFIDDGRHYLNKCKQHYDLVIIDALLGESVPSHLLSVECFSIIKKLLTPSGKIFIEFDGIEENDKGIAQQLLYNTIKAAGFNCQAFSSIAPEQHGDIMYLASMGTVTDLDTATIAGDFYYTYSGPLKQFKTTLATSTTELVTDNRPVLDYYLRNHMANFRSEMIKKQNLSFMEDDMAFYY